MFFQTTCPTCERFSHSQGICHACRKWDLVGSYGSPTQSIQVTKIRSGYWYTGPAKRWLHLVKYYGLTYYLKQQKTAIVDGFPHHEFSGSTLVPVPIHPWRRARRGFNQSELIAQYLGDALGMTVNSGILQRVSHTRPQVGLGAGLRRRNLKDSLDVQIQGGDRRIVLIDDVFTTGSTLKACTAALKNDGYRNVDAWTLFRGIPSGELENLKIG